MSAPPRAPLPPAILLMGPTASGKTDVAMTLARRFPVELVSVDSAQVFRDMNIGTAKPDAVTLARFPHQLIDVISPQEAYSAARFRSDALAAMALISARGKLPLLVGGTMLYFRALIEGLADLPAADSATSAARQSTVCGRSVLPIQVICRLASWRVAKMPRSSNSARAARPSCTSHTCR